MATHCLPYLLELARLATVARGQHLAARLRVEKIVTLKSCQCSLTKSHKMAVKRALENDLCCIPPLRSAQKKSVTAAWVDRTPYLSIFSATLSQMS